MEVHTSRTCGCWCCSKKLFGPGGDEAVLFVLRDAKRAINLFSGIWSSGSLSHLNGRILEFALAMAA